MGKKQTRQVEGIDVTLDPEIFEDWDVFETMTDFMSEDATDEEKMLATRRLVDLILGDQFGEIKKKMRAARGGKLPTEAVGEFVSKTIEAFGTDGKN